MSAEFQGRKDRNRSFSPSEKSSESLFVILVLHSEMARYALSDIVYRQLLYSTSVSYVASEYEGWPYNGRRRLQPCSRRILR